MRELDYIYGLRKDGRREDLRIMRELLRRLGDPQTGFTSFLVAGTNGKGSVTAMLARILGESGYRVGRLTSPHLLRFNERIVVNGQEIPDGDVARLIARIRTIANDMELSFTEFTTAMAFVYFKERDVQATAIEVGLGGRLDPTNILEPCVSVIASVGLDHLEHLGPLLVDIAREKAGVIREGSPLVTGVTDPVMLAIFRERTDRVIVPAAIELIGEDLGGQEFGYGGTRFRCPLLGAHQRVNAAIAIEAVRAAPLDISEDAIAAGIARVEWPGRFQIVARDPLVIVDGAHNEDGARALAAQLAHVNANALVLGVGKRKDARAILAILAPHVRTIVCTQGEYEALPAEDLAAIAREFCDDVRIDADPVRATLRLRERGENVLVAGSLYMIPAVIAHFTQSVTQRA